MRNDWKTAEFSASAIADNMSNKTFDVPKYRKRLI